MDLKTKSSIYDCPSIDEERAHGSKMKGSIVIQLGQ